MKNPPAVCPGCQSEAIDVMINEDAPGNWLLVCRDCPYREAYGARSVAMVRAACAAEGVDPSLFVLTVPEAD